MMKMGISKRVILREEWVTITSSWEGHQWISLNPAVTKSQLWAIERE
jgi:hypothetical protein